MMKVSLSRISLGRAAKRVAKKKVRGLSLIEVLVALGLTTMIMSMVLLLSMRAGNDFLNLTKANNEFYTFEMTQDVLTNAVKSCQNITKIKNGYELSNRYETTYKIVVEYGMLSVNNQILTTATKFKLIEGTAGIVRIILESDDIPPMDMEVAREALVE